MYRQFIGKRDDSQEAPAKLIATADSSYGERVESDLAEKFIELVVGTNPSP